MRILLSLLLLTTLILLVSTCSEFCTQLSYYACTICLTQCVSQETFSFGTCKERYCARYQTEYYYSNGEKKSRSYCAAYDFYDHSQPMCITSCCGDVGVGVSTFQGGFMKQCIEENDRLLAQVGIIVGCVLGGVALIVGGILFYRWRKNHAEVS